MNNLDLAGALRLAITVLRDSSDNRRMPSGISLGAEIAALHADAVEILELSLKELSNLSDG
ncbi:MULTISPECIES: hypothetical protein [unclassified Caballeronia]|uniref:hypothetical protein n=1 Tax=unclassified Caballeronia TaxID=2646786 RepID=UPI00285A90BC|nr:MULTISPECIES: hypothetical protein [unclassified Caballeronia]MDR5777524.1 hypothetical protein [Caballeronia sp. LZ002]MDR5852970.1 hypothetical protein [Caballeronia sp. LZ003]